MVPKPSKSALVEVDPLARVLAPPADEGEDDRVARLRAEEQAKKLSEDIDKYLRKAGDSAEKKRHHAVKVLLLGQSECGKSTALKNFQLLYNPQSFQAERVAWRMVIIFNLVQSIRVFHEIISDGIKAQQDREQQESQSSFGISNTRSPTSPIFGRSPGDFQDLLPATNSNRIHRKGSSGPSELHTISSTAGPLETTTSDAQDGVSIYSTSSSSTKQQTQASGGPTRRSSFFGSSNASTAISKKDSGGVGSGSEKSKKRPGTANAVLPSPTGTTVPWSWAGNGHEKAQTKSKGSAAAEVAIASLASPTATSSAFCLPTGTGSTRAKSPPQSQSRGRDAEKDKEREREKAKNPTLSKKERMLEEAALKVSTSISPSRHRSERGNDSSSSSTPSPTGRSPLSVSIPGSTSDQATPTSKPGRPPGLEHFRHSSRLHAPPSLSHQPLPQPRDRDREARGFGRTGDPTRLNEETQLMHAPVPPPTIPPSAPFTSHHQLLLMRLKPLLTLELALLRRLSLPDDELEPLDSMETETGKETDRGATTTAAVADSAVRRETEAVKLDFNLTGMHQAAVAAAKEGIFSLGALGVGLKTTNSTTSVDTTDATPMTRSVSSPGRARSRSSVDVTQAPTNNAANPAGGDNYRAAALADKMSSALHAINSNSTHNYDRKLAMKSSGNPGPSGAISAAATSLDLAMPQSYVAGPELVVRSSSNWKEKLRKWRKYDPSAKLEEKEGWHPWDAEDDPAHLIQACARDLMGLWDDPVVREYLNLNRYRLDQLPGFFLGDAERIVSRNYAPTNDDILRARLKTIGAVEHKLLVNSRGSMPRDWFIYDVGGSRTQRAAWVPFFDTCDAIIFIVPLSSFDQTLTEDQTVNRMEDSLRLFRGLISSTVLKDVNIILFLNKIDLLDSKLQSGIQLSRYFKRYGDRPNTTDAVIKYFRAKFTAIYDKFTPPHSQRIFSIHATELTNPESTKVILEAVNESILEAHVRRAAY